MGFFARLLGLEPTADINDLIHNQKAQIVDVRTPGEFKTGHVKKAVNIPLQRLNTASNRLKKNRPIVMCCASGARSRQATRILKSQGFDAHNGGSWHTVNRFV